jgi:arsenate reductase
VKPATRERVLFLCVHNSARSQMAEGLLRRLGGDRFDVASAGVEATYVKALAIEAMREVGIDISQQRSKSVHDFMNEEFDTVVTVCGEYESCPIPPRAKRLRHWPFEDPSRGEGIEAYRNVRDGLKRMIEIELL